MPKIMHLNTYNYFSALNSESLFARQMQGAKYYGPHGISGLTQKIFQRIVEICKSENRHLTIFVPYKEPLHEIFRRYPRIVSVIKVSKRTNRQAIEEQLRNYWRLSTQYKV